jgi:D-galactarolactone cycloisomerase
MARRGFKAEVMVHRLPISRPVRTSFGTMWDRPSVFIRLEDGEGHEGWGEVWCNYPSVGAEHRARLLLATVLPLAAELGLFDRPEALWATLSERLAVLAIQTGEAGPIAQAIAGLDCALQDLAARRAGLPLWRRLDPGGGARVPVYASGINPEGAAETAREAIAAGFAGAKLKIGFDPALDAANLRAARALVGPDVPLMADANQGWSLAQAMDFAPVCDEVGLSWLEEPLRHDAADADWAALAGRLSAPLAAGENFSSRAEFDDLPVRRRLRVLQPDLGKWGGAITSLAIGRQSAARGLQFCPHWLGSGIGLLATLHVKAASRTEGGYVEVDFNPNPMREAIVQAVVGPGEGGTVSLSDAAGIGAVGPVVAQFSDACVLREERSY